MTRSWRKLPWHWWLAAGGLTLAIAGVIVTTIAVLFLVLGMLATFTFIWQQIAAQQPPLAPTARAQAGRASVTRVRARRAAVLAVEALPWTAFGVLIAVFAVQVQTSDHLAVVPDTTSHVDQLPALPPSTITPTQANACTTRPSTRTGSFVSVSEVTVTIGDHRLNIALQNGGVPDTDNVRAQVWGQFADNDKVWMDITDFFDGNQGDSFVHGRCGVVQIDHASHPPVSSGSYVVEPGSGHAARACASGLQDGVEYDGCTAWHEFG